MSNRKSGIHRTSTTIALLALFVLCAPTSRAADPQPGEVYREFHVAMRGSTWRVTDPNATNPGQPGNTPGDYLPNAQLPLDLPSGALAGAVRANLTIDMWGGHVGTVGQRLRFNGEDWIDIPDLSIGQPPAESPAGSPECYTQQWNPVVTVPLGHLVEGDNILQGTSGGQTCFNFNWGQWGWYAATLRIYYNPSQVAHPSGSIVSPAAGSSFGDNPALSVDAASGRAIERVEFLAWYDGPDFDGDGVTTEFQQSYQREKYGSRLDVSHHAGTATGGATSTVWDTTLVPDQAPDSLRLIARICDTAGVCYVTPSVDNLTLDRTEGSVRLFHASEVPQKYWVRANKTRSSEVLIPDDLNVSRAVWAALLIRTWNGADGHASPSEEHHMKFNGWTAPNYGADHYYSFDVVEVPVSTLQNGANTITFYAETVHHGIEILWPGPELLVRFDTVQPGCGDGFVDSGEDCDDAGESPSCDSDCTFSVCGDGTLNFSAGEECDDANDVDSDDCHNDCTAPAPVTCGDGVVDAGEECDTGGETDTCDDDCSHPECGDGNWNEAAGEECDDGNTAEDDACLNDCSRPDAALAPAYYGFEGTGSTVVDSSGYDNHGTVAGARRSASGIFGNAMRFDGVAGYVDLGGLDAPGTGLTLMAWVRADDFGISDARIISKTTGPSEQDHYWMLSTINKNGIRLRFRLKTDVGGTSTLIATGATLPSSRWTHVAATYDGSSLRLFQDGVEVGSLPKSGTIGADPSVPAAIGDNSEGERTFDGLIDEVRIESRPLSADEIVALMDRPVYDPQACVSDSQCDDGSVCNGLESCLNGTCVTGEALDCDDGIACTDDACDEGAGGCVQLPVDAACDDGEFCNGEETCDGFLGCLSGPAPCSGGVCDDTDDVCVVSSTPALESGTVVVGAEPVRVLLNQAYVSPVIVCSIRYATNILPVVTRIDNVGAQSFDLRLQGAGHDAVAPDEVSYLVVEEGVWVLDGVPFEAHRYLSTVTDNKSDWTGERQSYSQDYVSPVVLGQVMSSNDSRWSAFWNRGADAFAPPSPTNLWTGKNVGEDPDRERADEWIGYVVIEAGHGTLAGVEYEARVGADSVRGYGVGAQFRYPFAQPFLDGAPAVTVVGMAGMDGANGGWGQTHSVDSEMMYASVDEDVANDAERLHTNEQLGYLALAQPLAYPASCPTGLPYSESFDLEPGANPADWYDTRSNSSLLPVDGFSVYTATSELAFGTRSRKDNLHSHYVGEGSDAWSDYTFRGRMLIAHADGGIGVTALSDYPESDRYYRLRRFTGERKLNISAHGTNISCDVPDTGVDPAPMAWYEFALEVRDLGDRTEILAKAWRSGEAEPDWQQRCTDRTLTRLTQGTVGVWSMGYAGKYWDSFSVLCNSGD